MQVSIVAREIIVGTAMLMLAACGSGGLSGTYEGRMGSLDFKSDGKVDMTGLAGTQRLSYEVDDDKVLIKAAEDGPSAMVLTIDKDNCLNAGGFAGKFCKKA